MSIYLLYTKIKVGDGLFRMRHQRWGRQLWACVKVRKEHKCVVTGVLIPKGSYAYRPVTNAGNRYERISCGFFEANR